MVAALALLVLGVALFVAAGAVDASFAGAADAIAASFVPAAAALALAASHDSQHLAQ